MRSCIGITFPRLAASLKSSKPVSPSRSRCNCSWTSVTTTLCVTAYLVNVSSSYTSLPDTAAKSASVAVALRADSLRMTFSTLDIAECIICEHDLSGLPRLFAQWRNDVAALLAKQAELTLGGDVTKLALPHLILAKRCCSRRWTQNMLHELRLHRMPDRPLSQSRRVRLGCR